MPYALSFILSRLDESPDDEFWRARLVTAARELVDFTHSVTCVRVSGRVTCKECGKLYYDHPELISGFHLLCDGRVGKT